MPTGSGSTAHRSPEAQADPSAPAPTDAAARTDAPAPTDAAASATDAGSDTDSDGRPGILGGAAAAAAGGAGVAGMTAAATDGAQADRYRAEDTDVAHDAPERSAASQWLILIAQVLASAVAGAALFIGFQLLWGDLPWVAFALAIIVIVGLVAMVRVLRRSNDTVSIALAVIVGLGVTCGPLLLRLIT